MSDKLDDIDLAEDLTDDDIPDLDEPPAAPKRPGLPRETLLRAGLGLGVVVVAGIAATLFFSSGKGVQDAAVAPPAQTAATETPPAPAPAPDQALPVSSGPVAGPNAPVTPVNPQDAAAPLNPQLNAPGAPDLPVPPAAPVSAPPKSMDQALEDIPLPAAVPAAGGGDAAQHAPVAMTAPSAALPGEEESKIPAKPETLPAADDVPPPSSDALAAAPAASQQTPGMPGVPPETPGAPVAAAPTAPGVEPAPAVPQAAAAAPEFAQVEALNKRIDELQSMVTRLSDELVTAQEAARKSPAVAAAEHDVAAPARHPHKKKKAAAPKAKKKAVVSAAKAEKKTAWILRGAKPGTAWVSEKGGALRTVTIGDRLSGLGEITAIVKDSSGRWVVNGTGGRLSQ